MIQKDFRVLLCASLALVLLPGVCRGQQLQRHSQAQTPAAGVAECPNQPPGVYLEGTHGWKLLTMVTPAKMKAKRAFLSSLTYGAVAAPMIVEYARAHAVVRVRTIRPTVCVSHMTMTGPAILIRLNVKKHSRELDSGSIRAIPFTSTYQMGHAQASSIVPSTTQNSENGLALTQADTDMTPGEYAVMFGASNLAIFDFGVDASAVSAP